MTIDAPPARRAALGWAAFGLAIVTLDFRVNGLDVLPDVIGWVMVAFALSTLPRGPGGFRVPAGLAWLAAVLSLADVKLPVPGNQGADPSTTASEAVASGPLGALGIAYVVADFAATVALCLAMRKAATAAADEATARTFGVLTAVLAGTGLLGVLGAALGRHADPPPAGLVLLVVLGGLAGEVWLIVALVRARNQDYLQQPTVAAVS